MKKIVIAVTIGFIIVVSPWRNSALVDFLIPVTGG